MDQNKRPANKRPNPRRRRRSRRLNPQFIAAVICLVGVLYFAHKIVDTVINLPQRPEATVSEAEETAPAETTEGEDPVVATASVMSTGDLLMHKPIINACKTEDGYDFSSIFQYIKSYVTRADYAVANLETSLGGPDCGTPYQGAPAFNCPDSILDAAQDAGFDMLLTANNHCGDTQSAGVIRTVEQIRARGLENVGTRADTSEKPYRLVEVNGIKLGILCYTYATDAKSDGRPQLNLGAFQDQAGLVNYYLESDLSSFYTEVSEQLAALEEEGAEATIFYIHWGDEYELQENATQDTIAQKLCDLGVDVIVGGHPHVVEPMALLQSSTDPEHKTVCLYSMGNAVSNQRVSIEEIAQVCATGHTEDGVLFTVTFSKTASGAVSVTGVELIPCWVDLSESQNYAIVPLEDSRRSQWQSLYNISDLSAAENSYSRTMAQVSEGLTQCQAFAEEN